MDAFNYTVQTAADLLAMLDRANLPGNRIRDLKSAVNRICRMFGCTPLGLRLDVPELRTRIAAIRSAAHGIEPQTFKNIRSAFTAALELTGVAERLPRGTARKDTVWATLAAAVVDDKSLSMGLAALMNWCSAKGVAPSAVDDAVVQRFLGWLETRTLYARPHDLVHQIPKLWAKAQDRVPGWPATALTPISFRPVSPNLRWEELPTGLRAEAEAYLALRAKPDLFDTNPSAPTRPLAASTIRQHRIHIRLAVSVLMRRGAPIVALAELVAVDAFKAVLRHYHDRANGKPNSSATGIAKTLIDVAHHKVGVSDIQLAELKKIAAKLPPVPFDLTEKNKALLRQLESESVRARLLFMPDALMQRVKADLKIGKLRFVEAQVAVAVELLLCAPLRPQNLVALNWTKNFSEPEGPRGKLMLYIPKDTTKSKRRDLVFEIPAELAENLRFFRREILPRLGGDPNGDLFVVNGSGKLKGERTLPKQITAKIAEIVGLHMTPHQFRHVAADFYLKDHPGDFRTVTDLLGHAWAKTTQIYAGASTRRASRTYGAHVIAQRQASVLKRKRGRG